MKKMTKLEWLQRRADVCRLKVDSHPTGEGFTAYTLRRYEDNKSVAQARGYQEALTLILGIEVGIRLERHRK